MHRNRGWSHIWSQVFSEFGHFWSPPAERSAEHLPPRMISSAQLGPAHSAPRQDSLPAVLAEVTKLVQRMLGPDITAHQVALACTNLRDQNISRCKKDKIWVFPQSAPTADR